MSYFSDSSSLSSPLPRPPPAYPGLQRNGTTRYQHPPPYPATAAQPRYPSDDYRPSTERYQTNTLGRYQKSASNFSNGRNHLSGSNTFQELANVLQFGKESPPAYYPYRRTTMDESREASHRDYDNLAPEANSYVGRVAYSNTLNRNLLNARNGEVVARNPSYLANEFPSISKSALNGKDYLRNRNYPSASLGDYDENNVRDCSNSSTNSDGLDMSRSVGLRETSLSREQTIPRDQSLSGFSRNFGGVSPGDLRISRESLDRPTHCQTPPSRQSMTPPSLHSATPPLRQSQASPLRPTQTPPMRCTNTPPFRPISNQTPPLQTPPLMDPQARYSMSPKLRYRTAEDYHYDYRGGYRPVDSEADGTVGGERQPFLSNVEPVRLTPSWEQSSAARDDNNFKDIHAFETFEGDADPPNDRLALVFLTLTLHGVGTLMPWNMFITAYSYFVDYKLVDEDGDKTEYAKNFLSYVGYASQVPNVIFNWINIFVQLGGDITTRIVGSILVEVALFILTVVLAMVDSSDWQAAFFWTTMVTIVIINIANGIYQNTVYGMAARLPFKYTGAVILGSNISGTFTSVINIIALLLAPNLRTSAIYYFITALFVLLACFDTYFALPLNRFFRYHEAQYEKTQKSKRVPGVGKARVPYWYIFKRAFPQLLNVFMVFFVTLSVFPAVLADTCRTDENFFIPTKLFQAITCYLTFNLMAMIGNMMPGLAMWPGPRFLWIPVFLRLLLVPAFLLCHYYPVSSVRIMPVLIDSDWAYWSLAIVLGVTSGYYSSLAMMYCPQTVEPEHAPVAGMMAAASLITGIFAGINFQMVCAWLVTNVSFDVPGFEYTTRNCTV